MKYHDALRESSTTKVTDPETGHVQTTTVEKIYFPIGQAAAREGVVLGVLVGNLGALAGIGLFTDILGFDHTVQVLRHLWVSNYASTPVNILVLLGCLFMIHRYKTKHNL